MRLFAKVFTLSGALCIISPNLWFFWCRNYILQLQVVNSLPFYFYKSTVRNNYSCQILTTFTITSLSFTLTSYKILNILKITSLHFTIVNRQVVKNISVLQLEARTQQLQVYILQFTVVRSLHFLVAFWLVDHFPDVIASLNN